MTELSDKEQGGKSASYPSTQAELIMAAWGLIANANEGFWDRATPEWRKAAVQWRDGFHKWLGEPDEWEYGALFEEDPSGAEPWLAGRDYEAAMKAAQKIAGKKYTFRLVRRTAAVNLPAGDWQEFHAPDPSSLSSSSGLVQR